MASESVAKDLARVRDDDEGILILHADNVLELSNLAHFNRAEEHRAGLAGVGALTVQVGAASLKFPVDGSKDLSGLLRNDEGHFVHLKAVEHFIDGEGGHIERDDAV